MTKILFQFKKIRTYLLFVIIILTNVELKSQTECDSLENLYPDVPDYWSWNDSVNQITYKKWYNDLPDCKKYRRFRLSEYRQIPFNKREIVKEFYTVPGDTILINDDFKDFENLKEIMIISCYIAGISKELFKLPKLKTLFIATGYYIGQDKNNFLNGISEAQQLETLEISEILGTETLSPEILELTNLQQLKIVNLNASSLPDKYQNLTKLKELTLTDLASSEIPTSLENLTQIEYLKLSGKGISYIPEFISDFKNLEFLDISGNIDVLDSNFGFFPKLTCLALSDNKLENIDNLIDNLISSDVKGLYYIDLTNNKFKKVPKNLTKFKSIVYLDLDSNDLESFDVDFSKTGLGVLELSNNKLKDIPKSISHSTESDLESPIVYMNDNNVEKLPDWIGEANFPFLYLKNNKIKYFGTELCRKNDLKKVYLDGNPIEDFDPKICECENGMLISIIGADEKLSEKIRKYNNLETDKVKIVTTEEEYEKYQYLISD
ncbi:MAG: leucine-rich repeat domain-containing protein [Ignavibacteriae bacterium]|nr:leucine-rich repeat domain-containing protein [Ignavibacteriota bacterium]